VRRGLVASAVLAALAHGFVLFGIDLDQPALPLPATSAPVVVSLVAAAPAPKGEEHGAAPAAPPPEAPPAAEPTRRKRARAADPTRPRVERRQVPRKSAASPSPPVGPAPENPARGAGTAGAAGGTPSGAEREAGSGATVVAAVPRYRMTPAPEYPAAARRLRQEGVVLLAVEVSAEGRPTAVSVARSSGVASLDEAAVRGVRRWRFDPARTAGLPVASRVEVPIRFRLDD
jgi:protein TonB